MVKTFHRLLPLLLAAGSLAAADVTVFITQQVSFSNNTVAPEGSVWMWDFGDKNGTSNLKEPKYAYPEPGVYKVVLKVKVPNIEKPIPSNSLEIEVNPVEPKVDFDPKKFFMGEEIDFKTQYDDRSGLAFEWDFGSDSNATQATAKHRFWKSGVQKATLLVKVPDGDTLPFPVSGLVADPITVAITGPTEVGFEAGSPITVTNSSTGPLALMKWNWKVMAPDGQPEVLTATDAASAGALTHVYESEGDYIVTLEGRLTGAPAGVVIPESNPVTINIASPFEDPVIKEISVAQTRIGENGDYTAQLFVDATGDYEKVEVTLSGLKNPPPQKKANANQQGRHVFKFTVPIPPESISRKPVSRDVVISATIHPMSPNAKPKPMPKSISLTIIPQQPGWILYLYIAGGALVMGIIIWLAIRTARPS